MGNAEVDSYLLNNINKYFIFRYNYLKDCVEVFLKNSADWVENWQQKNLYEYKDAGYDVVAIAIDSKLFRSLYRAYKHNVDPFCAYASFLRACLYMFQISYDAPRHPIVDAIPRTSLPHSLCYNALINQVNILLSDSDNESVDNLARWMFLSAKMWLSEQYLRHNIVNDKLLLVVYHDSEVNTRFVNLLFSVFDAKSNDRIAANDKLIYRKPFRLTSNLTLKAMTYYAIYLFDNNLPSYNLIELELSKALVMQKCEIQNARLNRFTTESRRAAFCATTVDDEKVRQVLSQDRLLIVNLSRPININAKEYFRAWSLAIGAARHDLEKLNSYDNDNERPN